MFLNLQSSWMSYLTFPFYLNTYVYVYGHYKYIFLFQCKDRFQNLTSIDVRFGRQKTVPRCKGPAIRPYIYGFKQILNQIMCHWNG